MTLITTLPTPTPVIIPFTKYLRPTLNRESFEKCRTSRRTFSRRPPPMHPPLHSWRIEATPTLTVTTRPPNRSVGPAATVADDVSILKSLPVSVRTAPLSTLEGYPFSLYRARLLWRLSLTKNYVYFGCAGRCRGRKKEGLRGIFSVNIVGVSLLGQFVLKLVLYEVMTSYNR